MSVQPQATARPAARTGSAAPTWWLVFVRELTDLWVGGRALNLILIYSILMGVLTYVLASNSELSLIPPQEMVYETLKTAIAVGVFIGLIIGADSISGERERATLEPVLLTPTSRRQIVLGKFLAAITPWPAALLITIPYMSVIAQGNDILIPAILWGALLGSVLAPAYTALGMFVSFWCVSNKTSFLISLGIYVLFLVPAQLPGTAQTGVAGQFLQWVNPMAAVSHFLSKHLVNNITLAEFWPWLISPVVFAAVVLGLLFFYASPGLRIEPGRSSRLLTYISRLAGVAVIAGLLVFGARPALAQELAENEIAFTIDADVKLLKAGDTINFNTVVTYSGAEESPAMMVAMNIVNLAEEGDPVDPEDWSPERAQYIEPLAPGGSASLAWEINAILDGDYMVYMVLIPEPEGQDATVQPISSAGIHLTVTPFTRLNPGGVLPYAIGGPIVVLLIIVALYRFRRRSVDSGAPSGAEG